MSAWFPPPEEAKALAEAVELLRKMSHDAEVETDYCFCCENHAQSHSPDCRLVAFLKRWGNGRP